MLNNASFTTNDHVLMALMANVMAAHARGDTITITPKGAAAEPAGKPFVGVTNGRRVEIPHGEKLTKTYLGVDLDVVVDNGKIRCDGELYDSLTGAALASGKVVNSKINAPNGYEWWKVLENGKWVRVVHSRFTEPAKK